MISTRGAADFAQRQRRRALATLSAATLLISSGIGRAVEYTYSRTTGNTAGTADNWSTGAAWDSTPISATDTTLTFTGSLSAATTIFTNNDIATGGPNNFVLNQLNFTYSSAVSGSALTISGNPLQFVSNGATTPTINISPGGASLPSLTINNNLVFTDNTTLLANSAATLGGSISGAGNLTKSGAGTLTFNATGTPSSYSGDLAITNGTIALNFSTIATSTSNIFGSGTSLIMGSVPAGLTPASLTVTGRNTNAIIDTQTFADTTFLAGRSALASNRGGSSTNVATLNLSAITRQTAALVSFTTNSTSNAFITTTTGNVNGILGGWATFGTSFASNSGTANANNGGTGGTNIVAYTGYTDLTDSTIANGAATNVRINTPAGGTPAGQITLNAGVTDINTLSIADNTLMPTTGSPTPTDFTVREIVIGSGNTLRLGTTGALWRNLSSAGTSNSNSGGTFKITGGTLTAGGPSIDTAGELILRADGDVSVTGNTTVQTQLFSTISSTISNNGTGKITLVKSGPQGISLTASNSYTGDTYILQGTLQVTQNDGFGTVGDIYVSSGGQAFAAGTSYAQRFFINGTGPNVQSGSITASIGALRIGSTTTISGLITLTGDANISNGTNSSIGLITGQITGPFRVSFNASGNIGTSLRISNPANDWTGDTIVAAQGTSGSTGTQLRLGANEVIPNGVGKGNLIISAPSNTNPLGELFLDGHNETVNGLLSAGSGVTDTRRLVVNGNATTASLLTIGDNNASASYQGQLNNGGAATLSLRKIGSGTQTIAGASSYTGTTTIDGGTLEIANDGTTGSPGALSGTTAININANATLLLSGANSITSRLNNAAAINMAGGTFNTGGLSEGDTTTTGVGTLNVTADSTIDLGSGGTSVLRFAGVTRTTGTMLTIADWTGTAGQAAGAERLLFSGTSASFPFLQSEVTFTGFGTGYQATDFGAYYEITPAVPEPSACLLIPAAAMGLLLRRRRLSSRTMMSA
jgi:autotransporter-associated beta strand protein